MSPQVAYGTPPGRWVIAAAVVGSGIAFLDGTVVTVALPAIARRPRRRSRRAAVGADVVLAHAGLIARRRRQPGRPLRTPSVFMFGLAGFALASALCAVAQTSPQLIIGRCLQGAAAAALVPGSLAIISATFRSRSTAPGPIGALVGSRRHSTAIGPFLGGWLIDSVSWRLVFLINVPVAAVAIVIAVRHVPESKDESAVGTSTSPAGWRCRSAWPVSSTH